MNYNEILLHPLFQNCSASTIQSLMNQTKLHIRSFHSNTVVHRQDESISYLGLLLHGTISIERTDIHGNLLTIATLKKNDILGGHLVFCTDGTTSGDIITKSDSRMLMIDRETILDLCQKDRHFLHVYLQQLSENTQRLSRKIQETAQKTIRDQLIFELRKQYIKSGETTIRLPINKKQLAQSFGVARTSVSRALKKLVDEQSIELDGRRITIKNQNWIIQWLSER